MTSCVTRGAKRQIVATIGPASEEAEPLAACVAAGMRVMRMNFSHATFDEVMTPCVRVMCHATVARHAH